MSQENTKIDKESTATMEKIISLCKRRGFIYPGSEIYGGLAGVYDFGPLGFELLKNIKNSWWNSVLYQKENYFPIDSGMFKNPIVWEASGHTQGFSDPLSECRVCNTRIRVDKILESIHVTADEKMSEEEINILFDQNRDKIKCDKCGSKDFTPVKKFNLLVKSNLGDFTSSGSDPVYLPGEACQGIYLNYKNIVDTMHPKIPFGIAQIGKAFRNEIAPRNFLFRQREFEQADTQFFVKPNENKQAYKEIRDDRFNWYTSLGIKPENMRWKQHENLVFYASDAWDIEYNFPWGFDEIEGIHDRTNYDLTQHMEFSKVDLHYIDSGNNEKYIPWILETSMGVARVFLAVLCDAYYEDDLGGELRTVLKLDPSIAPYIACVSPLLKNKQELKDTARDVFMMLKKEFGNVAYDDNGNVGKRYRRQDEIGTPYCIVIDFDTTGSGTDVNPDLKNTVTIRHRDTGAQERVSIDELISFIRGK